ncbi:hypothetical protein JL720_12575 [Aureococcus anophagefferens]|nr:hypothetical protein JL720_12575 [Aureococcus anophagefferens]
MDCLRVEVLNVPRGVRGRRGDAAGRRRARRRRRVAPRPVAERAALAVAAKKVAAVTGGASRDVEDAYELAVALGDLRAKAHADDWDAILTKGALDVDSAEVALLRDEASDRRDRAAALAALAEGRPRGAVGSLDVGAVDDAPLRALDGGRRPPRPATSSPSERVKIHADRLRVGPCFSGRRGGECALLRRCAALRRVARELAAAVVAGPALGAPGALDLATCTTGAIADARASYAGLGAACGALGAAVSVAAALADLRTRAKEDVPWDLEATVARVAAVAEAVAAFGRASDATGGADWSGVAPGALAPVVEEAHLVEVEAHDRIISRDVPRLAAAGRVAGAPETRVGDHGGLAAAIAGARAAAAPAFGGGDDDDDDAPGRSGRRWRRRWTSSSSSSRSGVSRRGARASARGRLGGVETFMCGCTLDLDRAVDHAATWAPRTGTARARASRRRSSRDLRGRGGRRLGPRRGGARGLRRCAQGRPCGAAEVWLLADECDDRAARALSAALGAAAARTGVRGAGRGAAADARRPRAVAPGAVPGPVRAARRGAPVRRRRAASAAEPPRAEAADPAARDAFGALADDALDAAVPVARPALDVADALAHVWALEAAGRSRALAAELGEADAAVCEAVALAEIAGALVAPADAAMGAVTACGVSTDLGRRAVELLVELRRCRQSRSDPMSLFPVFVDHARAALGRCAAAAATFAHALADFDAAPVLAAADAEAIMSSARGGAIAAALAGLSAGEVEDLDEEAATLLAGARRYCGAAASAIENGSPPAATMAAFGGDENPASAEMYGDFAGVEMTKKFMVDLCMKHDGYRTPHVNDKLYLHQQGFRCIEPSVMGLYTGVRSLWLQQNGLTKIQGLENCVEVKTLMLHENCIASSRASRRSATPSSGAQLPEAHDLEIKTLRYLDDRPVFEDERRRCEAWARGFAEGGTLDAANEAERAEIAQIRADKKAAEDKRVRDFENFIADARAAKAADDAAKGLSFSGDRIVDPNRPAGDENGPERRRRGGPFDEAAYVDADELD